MSDEMTVAQAAELVTTPEMYYTIRVGAGGIEIVDVSTNRTVSVVTGALYARATLAAFEIARRAKIAEEIKLFTGLI